MKLEFPKALQKRMRRNLGRAGRREIGGVLMAEQLAPGHFRLADFSLDSRTGEAAHFVRSVDEHYEALAQFYARTGSDFARFNYLGEWHSHPNHVPLPSDVDVASMESLVRGERDIDFAVLIIVRKAWWRRMTCSATLFQRGRAAEPVELVPCY